MQSEGRVSNAWPSKLESICNEFSMPFIQEQKISNTDARTNRLAPYLSWRKDDRMGFFSSPEKIANRELDIKQALQVVHGAPAMSKYCNKNARMSSFLNCIPRQKGYSIEGTLPALGISKGRWHRKALNAYWCMLLRLLVFKGAALIS